MIAKYRNYIIGFCLFLALLGTSYIFGCQRGKKIKKCPEIVTHTVIIHDTITYNIVDSFPYYIQGKEKIVYRDIGTYKIVDTAFILKDYFALHIINRTWEDSLLRVDISDYISENKPIHNNFEYKILRDQIIYNTTVDNSVNFARYAYFGVGLPCYPFKANRDISNINYINLEFLYAYPKGFVKIGWQPYVEQISLSAGVKILKFKK